MPKRSAPPPEPDADPLWQKTSFANLMRYVPSGKYFARVRVAGKLIRRSLKTTVLSVAKLKLADFEKGERAKAEANGRVVDGKATVADLIAEYKTRLEGNYSIKPRTREYYLERLAALLKSWPELEKLDVRRVLPEQCRNWASRYQTKSSPTNFNNTVAVLRSIFAIAVQQCTRYTNPATGIPRTRTKPKQLTLPTQAQFHALVDEIRRVPFGPGLASGDLVEFLAYSGLRKSEAANVTWGDCDLKKKEILVRGDAHTGTKNGEVRRVPMISDMVALLDRLWAERRSPEAGEAVMRVKECQGTLTRACRTLKVKRITHHDLRHLFATRCIETGVDIPTVSRWLGHKGALAMKVYGHLRDQHSVAMAQKVTFKLHPAAKG